MEALFILTAVILAGIVLLVVISFKRKRFSEKEKQFFSERWMAILSLQEADPAKALLEADKLVDFALKKSGCKGTFGEKLKSSGKLFSNCDGLWKAHKLRNRVVHEVHAKVSREEAGYALHEFKKALQDLGL